jgi:3-hydroxyacyl-[acyl-carrier-protein] dehydratase
MAEAEARRLPHVLAAHRTPDRAEIELAVPADLVWFHGHFPGTPILPGVVQIAWAVAMARAHLSLDVSAPPVIRVKFQTVIQPDDRVTLVLQHVRAKGAIDFEYRKGGRACSSGRLGGWA